MERGTGQLRLQERPQPSVFQASPHLLEGRMAIPPGADQGCDSTSAREPRRRLRREKAVNDRRNLQTPSDAEDQRQVGDGRNLLYGRGPAVPPVVALFDSIIALYRRIL